MSADERFLRDGSAPPTGLLLIAGFLGSGKTTLLNRLLSFRRDERTGVIVNEFGDLGIDGELIRTNEEIVELNGGQIFCTCLSPAFLQSLVTMSRRRVDLVITEASGLARPATLTDLLAGLESRNPGLFRYRGLITVVDAGRFLKLAPITLAVEEQVRFANTVLINKADLVEPEELEQLEAHIRSINPKAEVRRTVRCDVGPELLKSTSSPVEADPTPYLGWGEGRPVALALRCGGPVDRSSLEVFVRSLGTQTLRVKGFVELLEGPHHLDAVGDQWRLESWPSPVEGARLTVILRPGPGKRRLVEQLWTRTTGARCTAAVSES